MARMWQARARLLRKKYRAEHQKVLAMRKANLHHTEQFNTVAGRNLALRTVVDATIKYCKSDNNPSAQFDSRFRSLLDVVQKFESTPVQPLSPTLPNSVKKLIRLCQQLRDVSDTVEAGGARDKDTEHAVVQEWRVALQETEHCLIASSAVPWIASMIYRTVNILNDHLWVDRLNRGDAPVSTDPPDVGK